MNSRVDQTTSPEHNETYLGDAVYASFDGYQIKLRTGDGNAQVIYLEPSVWHALQNFVALLSRKRGAHEVDGK